MQYQNLHARASSFAALALLTLCPACDSSGPPTGEHPVQPVEGRVLFQGKPLAGAEVSFHPADEAKFGASIPRPTGQTDSDGHYQLMTYSSGDGAPVGSYLVAISGVARPQSEASSLVDPKRPMSKTDVLRGRFLDPKTSKIKAEVKEGKNVIDPFELK